jgi:putative membrane protein
MIITFGTLFGFLTHFAAGLVLVGLGAFLFMRVTPHDEVALIRAGNTGAAIALGGTVLGMALPIASAITNSANLLDAAVWGVIAVIAQIGAYLVVSRLLGSEGRAALEQRGEAAGAVLKASVSLAVGALNAAAMST